MKGETSKLFTGEQVDEIAAKYRGGATVEALATEYKCSTAPIRNALRMRGITRDKRGARTGNYAQALNRRIS